MTDTKTDDRAVRQADLDTRVAELRAKAAVKQAASDRIRSNVCDDYAFWTQPATRGSTFANQRDKQRRKIVKAGEILTEAKALSDKADSMERRGVVIAGDSKARYDAKVAACNVTVGMMVATPFYGIRKVIKVNRISVSLESMGFGPIKIGKEFVTPIRQPIDAPAG